MVGEQINATSGLGFMITQAQQFLNNSVIMVALIVYAILGLLLDGAVRLLERKALAWRRDLDRRGTPSASPASADGLPRRRSAA